MNNSNFPTSAPDKVAGSVVTETVSMLNELRNLPDVNHRDAEAVKDRIDYCFRKCRETGARPTVEMLSLALHIDRTTFYRWSLEKGDRGNVIRNAKSLLGAAIEQWFITGKINPAAGIFLLKNHFGYRDSYDLETAVGKQDELSVLPSREEIIKKLGIVDD